MSVRIRTIYAHVRAMGVGTVLATTLTGCASAPNWTRTWEAAMQGAARPPARIASLQDRTLRQVVRVSSGGERWRLHLSNERSPASLRLGAVRVALQAPDGSVMPGSDRAVHFLGAGQTSIAAGATLDSDPIDLSLRPLISVVVSLYFPDATQGVTFHAVAVATGQIAPGDQTAAAVVTNAVPIVTRAVLSAIDIQSPSVHSAVIAFGDSITDGVGSTLNANHRWPDLLADRLQAARAPIAVANAGIASNQLLRDGVGQSGVERFAEDALAAPSVSYVIVLEGINDIGLASREHRPCRRPTH